MKEQTVLDYRQLRKEFSDIDRKLRMLRKSKVVGSVKNKKENLYEYDRRKKRKV